MEMLPVILNTNFEKLGIIDDYISFIWTERYYSPGDFELCVPINEKSLSLIKKDYYVRLYNSTEDYAIIEEIKFTKIDRLTDAEEMIVVKGRFLSSILSRRIIATQTQVKGKIQECIKTLINDNAINPKIVQRKIPNLSFQSSITSDIKIETQYTGKNLLESIDDLCLKYGLGNKITLENGKFIFKLYEGTNRSFDQSENPFIVFSKDYDNLESSDYEEDYTTMITDVLVAGEGEGVNRKTQWAHKTANSGLARYEIFQDARNASTNNGQIKTSVYLEQLRQEGLEHITEYTKAFAGKVFFTNYTYKDDVYLGDICTVQNEDWNIYINTRLIEMIYSTDESGKFTMTPTFGV